PHGVAAGPAESTHATLEALTRDASADLGEERAVADQLELELEALACELRRGLDQDRNALLLAHAADPHETALGRARHGLGVEETRVRRAAHDGELRPGGERRVEHALAARELADARREG